MKNITLSADERLIKAARARARAEHSTLNDQFRQWLYEYVQPQQAVSDAMQVIQQLQSELRTSGKKFSREEMNER